MKLRYYAAAAAALFALAACGDSAEIENTDSDAPSYDSLTFNVPEGVEEVNGLKVPAAFDSIENDEERSAAMFAELSKVVLHPRCANCHPRGDGGPTQGDNMEPHNPPMPRGATDFGPDAMMCTTCHGTENVTYASMEGSIPGNEPWHLAPKEMGWAHMTDLAALCAQMKDPETNGGRSLEDLVRHNGVDHLVGWAWDPGEGRTPAPGSQDVFGALNKAWVDSGGHCPT